MANVEEEEAMSLALKGHNVFISGQCGTGKTFLLRKIMTALKERGKEVAVTASIGMAAIPLRGTTVHHWAGLGDNRHTKEKILETLNEESKARITKADVLILDEVGMISEAVFSKLEFITRNVRGNNLVFGGLQLIACGDFKQLPPVPDSMHLDPGDYCFQAEEFRKALPHKVILKQVRRQDEPQLVKAVRELCDGEPSEETNAFIKSLDRPISDAEVDPTMLFGVNFDVDYMNQQKLDDMPGQAKIYKAVDSGETGLLSKCQAPKVLSLKVGAPVILLKNMTKGLCNGTKGIVQSIDGDDPIINFNGKLYTLSKVLFEVFDTRQDKVRASRFQYPLKLAFCLTVHKAQGRTEPYLEVDCFSFFAPGQLGVAIGRAVSIKNLRVRNYSPNCATIKHLPHVYEFYDTCDIEGTGVSVDDFSCCRPEAEDGNRTGPAIPPTTDEPSVDPWANVSQLSRSSPSQPQHDDMFDLSECPPPEGITVNQERLVQYVGSMHDTVSALLPRDGQGKDAWASAFRLFHQYLLSVEYKQRLCLLFETTSVSPVCNRYATKLAFSVHHAIVAARADAIRERNENAGKCSESPKSPDLSDIAKAKIRYLAGACMSRITTRLRGKALSDITNTIHSTSRKHAYDQHKLLAGLRVSETHVTASTSEPASLSEIDYKQSSTRGLFHIPDNVFHFFLELHVTARMYLTHSNFDAHQGNAFTVCRQKVFDDAELHRQWCALFPLEETRSDLENELSQGLINELYNQVAEHYIRICFVDALHEMKEKLPKTKKQALRAKIEGATKVKVCVKPEQKRKNESIQMFHCPVCKDICVEEPQSRSESSIGCDGCNEWFHLPCAKVSNPKKIKKWFCVGCTK